MIGLAGRPEFVLNPVRNSHEQGPEQYELRPEFAELSLNSDMFRLNSIS